VLDTLRALPVPRIIETLDGARHVVHEGRTIHLFEEREGEPRDGYLHPDDRRSMRAAMTRLAEIHRHLARAPMPCVLEQATEPSLWLGQRLARVTAGDIRLLPHGSAEVLRRIEELLETVCSGSVQWLHGDYHLGNLLWRDEEVVGIVDFDDTACGTATSEAAMALFALARQDGGEKGFCYDRSLWNAGLAAYVDACGDPATLHAEDLELVFCGYQVLIHFEAVQHGLWSLTPGIGFWPCWNSLVQSP
jgi:Ser/Thr protein kinase RdoA (MazF antagonist)